MAGSYADAPGRKVPYDVDGSVAFRTSVSKGGTITLATTAQLQALNDEGVSTVWAAGNANASNTMGVIFPMLTDIVGIVAGVPSTNTALEWETSVDTTNGLDGTWVSRSTSQTFGVVTGRMSQPFYRTDVVTSGGGLPWTSVKAVRINKTWGGDASWHGLHLYGPIPTAVSPDRITLWHPTLNQELDGAGLDFGDVTRGGTSDKTFRVKNLSATLTANSILLSMSALTEPSPTFVSQYTLGVGGTFAATQTIANLAPGAISAVHTLRLTVSASASLSVARQRLSAVPQTWS